MPSAVRSSYTLSIALCLAIAPALAQLPGDPSLEQQRSMNGITEISSLGSTIRVTVKGEDHKFLPEQAVVRVNNLLDKTTYFETTRDNSEAIVLGITRGQCEVEISAVGYLSAHLTQTITPLRGSYPFEVILKKDPAAINLDEAQNANVAPPAHKQVQRGVTFLKSGDLKQAEKALLKAQAIEPANPQINFLLGYLYMQRQENANAQTYLEKATAGNPRDVQALTMLGKLHLVAADASGARALLQRAVAAEPGYWNAQYLLSDACLKLKDYSCAGEHAQLAIDAGKGAAGKAYLVLGQAEARLGNDPAALSALHSYLQVDPGGPSVAEVKGFIEWIEQRAQDRKKGAVSTSVYSADSALIPSGNDSDEVRLAASGWAPQGVDDTPPALAGDTPCPSDQVLNEAGKRVVELVNNVSKFAAIEAVMHENLDASGHPVSHETRRFDYSVEISPSDGKVAVAEYRTTKGDLAEFPEHIATRGFPALALVFHPNLRDGFQMTCEGLGQWKNQATWLVHFRQRADRPNRMHAYVVGNQMYPVSLKGRAWIAAGNFQIVHIESELVKSIPNIKLLTEHQLVDYGPVLFASRKEELWLPKEADIYMDFQRKRFHRRHSFDHFLLFAVDSDSKDKAPVAPPTPDKPTTPVVKGPVQ